MRQAVLIAEDDPVLAQMLKDYLAGRQFAVSSSTSNQELRRWLAEKAGLLLLDGSVFKQMGVPLADLPRCVVICSGDRELVEEARQLGLRAILKGNLDGLAGLLQEVG